MKQLTCLIIILFLSACGEGPQKPVDGKTRQVIDSIVGVEQRKMHAELDSICRLQHRTVLPALVDSIKKIRLKEIEEQMKTVPK